MSYRPAGVRVKAPSTKDVLDMGRENTADRPEQLRITAPPLYTPRRFVGGAVFAGLIQKWRLAPVHVGSFLLRHPLEDPPTPSQSNSSGQGKTHVWVSSRHGDLSEWGPYSGLEQSLNNDTYF